MRLRTFIGKSADIRMIYSCLGFLASLVSFGEEDFSGPRHETHIVQTAFPFISVRLDKR